MLKLITVLCFFVAVIHALPSPIEQQESSGVAHVARLSTDLEGAGVVESELLEGAETSKNSTLFNIYTYIIVPDCNPFHQLLYHKPSV